MAHIKIGDIVVTPVADPAAGVALYLHDLNHAPTQQVEIRPYAAGNHRAVRRKGTQKAATVNLANCTDAQVAFLKAWQGQTVCFRDCTGEKFFGIYDGGNYAPRPMGDSWVVPLTVTQLTWHAS